jgi:hypothetical protein
MVVRRLGGPQNPFGRFGEEKKSVISAGIRIPGREARSLVTAPSASSWGTL